MSSSRVRTSSTSFRASRNAATLARSSSPHTATQGGSASTSATTWKYGGALQSGSAANIAPHHFTRMGGNETCPRSPAEEGGQDGAPAEHEQRADTQAEQGRHD